MDNIPFFTELISPYNVPLTVEKIIGIATQKQWQNPALHDMQQTLANNGREVRPVQVIELCKTEFSGQILDKNDERIVSVLMPCRISVYEKNDGKTYISLFDVKAMTTQMPAAMAKVLQCAADEMIRIVNTAIAPD